MFRFASQQKATGFYQRRCQSEKWILLWSAITIAMLAASTVVAGDAFRLLPDVLKLIVATPNDEVIERSARRRDRVPETEPVFLLQSGDYVDSWRQSGTGRDHRGRTSRSHQVDIDRDGRLTGLIVTLNQETGEREPLVGADVRFYKAGARVVESRTNEAGLFEVAGLTEGSYALLAYGADSLLAYGVHFKQSDELNELADADTTSLPIGIRLESAAITGADVSSTLAIIAAHESLSHPSPPAIREVEPSRNEIPFAVRQVRQVGIAATTIVSHRLALQPDGSLLGRVLYLHPETGRPLRPRTTEVTLLQEGERVGVARTDEEGRFSITGMSPGVHAVIAKTIEEAPQDRLSRRDIDRLVGSLDERNPPHGMAAFAIEVVAANSLSRLDQPGPQLVDFTDTTELLELDIALAPFDGQLLEFTAQLQQTPNPDGPASMSGGSMTSSGATGGTIGGGGVGGGGLPGIPALAITTGLLTPLFFLDGDHPTNPVSPSAP